MSKDVYLICPVRNASPAARAFLDDYVARLESRGITVHYPPRDVDQSDDGIGLELNTKHRQAMLSCREVHVVWDPASFGSHFDLGMAFMLSATKNLPIVIARPFASTEQRSYGNILRAISSESEL